MSIYSEPLHIQAGQKESEIAQSKFLFVDW